MATTHDELRQLGIWRRFDEIAQAINSIGVQVAEMQELLDSLEKRVIALESIAVRDIILIRKDPEE